MSILLDKREMNTDDVECTYGAFKISLNRNAKLSIILQYIN